MPGYNVLNDELTQRVKQVVNQYMACNQLRPQPGRRRRGGGGGGGGGKKTAIVRATASIAAARQSNGVREAVTSYDFDKIAGDEFETVDNWSQVVISVDTYMVIIEVDGKGVIVSAFC